MVLCDVWFSPYHVLALILDTLLLCLSVPYTQQLFEPVSFHAKAYLPPCTAGSLKEELSQTQQKYEADVKQLEEQILALQQELRAKAGRQRMAQPQTESSLSQGKLSSLTQS